jgi:zinc protease
MILTTNQASFSSHSLPGPDDITRVQLPNGITVLARSNFNSPSVVISGYLTAGSLFESDEKLGLASFTASALMRGTAQHSFQEIYDKLESVGASLGFNGGVHTTGFGGKCLVEDLEMLVALLTEILTQPVFPDEQIERLRAQFLTGLAIRAQDTAEMASLAFDQIIYVDHPYARPEDGYPETIQSIRREDLIEFHRKYYGGRGMVMSIVGAIQPLEGVELVTRMLGDWDNPGQPIPLELPHLTALTKIQSRTVEIPGKFQSDIVIGTAGPARRAPDYLAANLGNSILGQFGMMGRIGDVVREQAGLAYYASSSLNGGSGPGSWEISAGVDPANVKRAIELICAEIARFTREPVSTEELDDNQANFIGRLPLSMESNGGVSASLVNLERYDLGLDYYHRYPDLVRAITVDQILAAAQHYFDPERLGIAVAGP